jgi:PLP dependent protein
MPRISEKIESVQTRLLNAAQYAELPLLLAVSKTRSADDIQEAATCGLIHFGENYLQEALPKIAALKNLHLVWHFIGSIQSNKTTDIANHFDWVHTVDREKIARRLSEQRPETLPDLNLLIQINIDTEDSKSGVRVEDLSTLAEAISSLPRVKLRGLMAIPKPRTDYAEQLAVCQRVRTEFERLQQLYPEIDTLSLGMSADLEAAIEAGSNLVRIGTDIFGARPAHNQAEN